MADRVGTLMRRTSQACQVLAITHLPQVASKADQHLHVSKGVDEHGTYVRIQQLDEEERLLTIAQMLSGKRTTKAAMENAKALLKG